MISAHKLYKGTISVDTYELLTMLSKRSDIANTHGYEIIAMKTDKDHMHFLICYDTTDRVSTLLRL